VSGSASRDQVEADRFIAVGRITRAHGIHGEVAVLPLSQVESRFEPESRLFVEDADRWLTVRSSRPHRQRLLVRFLEIEDRTSAEELGGRYLVVPASAVPAAPEGEFWPHELVGCEMVTDDGRSLGRVREIIHTPANDVWMAGGPDGEVLVPALKDLVLEVDVPGRLVVVRAVPGLTAP
jgi:16S rRNA processing protein RimM